MTNFLLPIAGQAVEGTKDVVAYFHDQGDTDKETRLNMELMKYQHTLRNINPDHLKCSRNNLLLFQNMDKILKSLEHDKEEIMTQIGAATAAYQKAKDEKLAIQNLNELQKKANLNRLIKKEKKLLSEIDVHIRVNQKKLKKAKLKDVSDYYALTIEAKHLKNIRALENRLEGAKVKVAKLLTQNKQLKQEINSLLNLRQIFLKYYNDRLNKLNIGKKIMLDLIEIVTFKYDYRDVMRMRIATLKDRGHKQMEDQSHEMRNGYINLTEQVDFHNFIALKTQKRDTRELEAKIMKKKLNFIEEQRSKIESCKSLLEEIRQFTGIDNVDLICKSFQQQRETNFSTFTYILNLFAESRHLEDDYKTNRKKINELRALNRAREYRGKANVDKLEYQYEEALNCNITSEKRLENSDQRLHFIFGLVDQLASKIGINRKSLDVLLGDNQKCNRFNVTQYLKLIGEQIFFFMILIYYRQCEDEMMKIIVKDSRKVKPNLMDLDTFVPASPCPLCIELEHMAVMDDEFIHPLSRPEATYAIRIRHENSEDLNVLHNVSQCRLPKARRIMQKRFQ